jgi:pimeloyl-ACP methyl ester carboxylesterase
VERLVSAVVLLHAFPLDHRMWDSVADDIAISGWQVFTPDFRGCGNAADWAEGQAPSLRILAQDVLALMDQFGIEKFVVGGCSLGGYVAMELMRIAPQRIAAAIFIDTKASADNEEQIANRQRIAEQVATAGSTEAFWRAMVPNVIGKSTFENSPQIVDYVKSLMSDSRVNGVVNLQNAMSQREDSTSVISDFKGPLLSIRGLEDTVANEADHKTIMDAACDGLHVEIANSGHLASIENPVETADAIIRFLGKLSSPSC